MTADVLSVEPGRYCPRCGELNDDEHRCDTDRPHIADRFAAGHVLAIPNAGYAVQSRTTTGVWYLVSGEGCTCKAGQARRRCWHVAQADAFARALNDRYARPQAPSAPVAFFVD